MFFANCRSGCSIALRTDVGAGWHKPTEPLAMGALSHDDMLRLLPTFNKEHGPVCLALDL